MLMNVKCSTITSIEVKLTFDDGSTKSRIISVDDIIDVEYNSNGCRKCVEGKVLKIKTEGTDPKGWYILVDSSEDYGGSKAKFSPMSILDVDIIKKGGSIRFIETPTDMTGIEGLRIVQGRLQYTLDGYNWNEIKVDRRTIIKDEEGTIPDFSRSARNEVMTPYAEGQDVIKDEIY